MLYICLYLNILILILILIRTSRILTVVAWAALSTRLTQETRGPVLGCGATTRTQEHTHGSSWPVRPPPGRGAGKQVLSRKSLAFSSPSAPPSDARTTLPTWR